MRIKVFTTILSFVIILGGNIFDVTQHMNGNNGYECYLHVHMYAWFIKASFIEVRNVKRTYI